MNENEAKIALQRYVYLKQEIDFPFKAPPITISQLILTFLIAFGLAGIIGAFISKNYSDIFTSIAIANAILLIIAESYINSLKSKLSEYFKSEYNEEDFDSGVENLLKNI